MKENILILGGTNVIGRCVVETLLVNDLFNVYTFNRGKTNPELFNDSNVTRILGDRNNEKDIAKIKSIEFDYIIDLSCFHPNNLKLIIDTLNINKIKKYVLISSVSVYDLETKGLLDEKSKLKTFKNEYAGHKDYSASYGERKAECERILIQSGVNYSILRPANIYGKYSHSDKLYFWIYICQLKKEIYVPENYENKNAYISINDLVKVIIFSLKYDANIICNAINEYISIKEIISFVGDILNVHPKLIFIPNKILTNYNIVNDEDRFSDKEFKKKFGSICSSTKENLKKTMLFYEKKGFICPENFNVYNHICSQFF